MTEIQPKLDREQIRRDYRVHAVIQQVLDELEQAERERDAAIHQIACFGSVVEESEIIQKDRLAKVERNYQEANDEAIRLHNRLTKADKLVEALREIAGPVPLGWPGAKVTAQRALAEWEQA